MCYADSGATCTKSVCPRMHLTLFSWWRFGTRLRRTNARSSTRRRSLRSQLRVRSCPASSAGFSSTLSDHRYETDSVGSGRRPGCDRSSNRAQGKFSRSPPSRRSRRRVRPARYRQSPASAELVAREHSTCERPPRPVGNRRQPSKPGGFVPTWNEHGHRFRVPPIISPADSCAQGEAPTDPVALEQNW